MSLALMDGRHTGIFNIGTGAARSFRDLAEATFRAFGREPAIDYVDMPIQIRDKYQYFTQASLDRVRQAGTGLVPRTLEETVRDYVQAYLAADDPYR